jgi:hypothetical protein
MSDFHAASYEDLSAGGHFTFRLYICIPFNLLKMHEYMDCQQKDRQSTDQNESTLKHMTWLMSETKTSYSGVQ